MAMVTLIRKHGANSALIVIRLHRRRLIVAWCQGCAMAARGKTYMEWRLSVDVLAIHVDFVIVEQRDYVVDVCVRDRVEQYVTAHFFYLSNHFLQKQLIIN